MNQLNEVSVLFKKRIAQLERKKQQCLDYSSTPNRCASAVEAKIKRMKAIERVSRFRKRTLESDVVVDGYLNTLQEKFKRPNSPVAKVVTVGALAAGAYKTAKWRIMKDRCKKYEYSPYLHNLCMKDKLEDV